MGEKSEKKIVVFGKGEVGKSTLLKGLIHNSVNISHRGRTTAFDYGILHHKGIKYHFFGTPGQHHFSMVREVLTLGVDGIIFVIDGTQGVDDGDRQIFKEVEATGIPYLMVINLKNGRNQGIGIEELQAFFKTDRTLCRGVVRGSVLDPDSQREILLTLEGVTK